MRTPLNIRSGRKSTGRITATLLLMLSASTVGAAENNATILRSPAQIASVKIYGVSLDMTPHAAFNHLMDEGFRAGTLRSFEEWDTNNIEFVSGVYGSSDGYTSLSMARRGDRIISLSETFNAPGSPIDADSAIADLKDHFGIQEDTRRCTSPRPNAALCQVRDAEGGSATHTFSYQIMSTMRIVTIARPLDRGG